MEEGLKFKILVLDPDHAPFEGILSRLWWNWSRYYPCTEFEVSSFTGSNFTEGGLKFKNSPDHAPFKVCMYACMYMCIG